MARGDLQKLAPQLSVAWCALFGDDNVVSGRKVKIRLFGSCSANAAATMRVVLERRTGEDHWAFVRNLGICGPFYVDKDEAFTCPADDARPYMYTAAKGQGGWYRVCAAIYVRFSDSSLNEVTWLENALQCSPYDFHLR